MSLTILREFAAAGQEVIPLDWQDNPAAEEAAGRPCRVLPAPWPRFKTALWHLFLLRRLARRAIPHDVLVNPSAYPNAFGRHRSLALFVLDLSALEPGYYRPAKRLWFRLFYGAGLRRARLRVCISAYTRSLLLRRYPDLDPARCPVVHLGVERTLSPPAATRPPADPPYFLFVGTLEKRKNVLRLLEAFATARKRGVVAELRLAGREGKGGSEILRRAAQADLSGCVRLLGPVGDAQLRELYRGTLALLYPSLDEGFGLPILEAMQAGAPVLTSKVAAMPEVAGDAALLVDPLDGQEIAFGIVALSEDAALRARLATLGRERLTAFEPEDKAAELLAALESMLQRQEA